MPSNEHPSGRELATRLFERYQGYGAATQVAAELKANVASVYKWRKRMCVPAYLVDQVRALLGEGPPPGK